MALRIRQIALVAADLEPVVRQLCETLGVEVCFRDPGVGAFGLRNALLPIGDTFLEVVSPERDGTTAGRLLERRGGDGGYMVLLQTDALAADCARFARLGVRVVWSIELDDIAAVHLHPKDVGAAIVSFDQPQQPHLWRWGGPSWQQHVRTERVVGIAGVELQSEDPGKLAARWAQVLDMPSHASEGGAFVIDLPGSSTTRAQQLRFVRAADGRAEGMSGVMFQCAPGVKLESTTLCGTRLQFV